MREGGKNHDILEIKSMKCMNHALYTLINKNNVINTMKQSEPL